MFNLVPVLSGLVYSLVFYLTHTQQDMPLLWIMIIIHSVLYTHHTYTIKIRFQLNCEILYLVFSKQDFTVHNFNRIYVSFLNKISKEVCTKCTIAGV